MILLKGHRFWRNKRRHVLAVLVCALGLLPVGYGQTDRVSQLIDELRGTDSTVRRLAAQELAKVKDPRAVEPFIAALKDTDSEVRRGAADALGESKDPRAVEPLIAALRDTNPDVRRKVVYALGESKDSRAVEPLIAALKDTSPIVRRHAAEALGEINDPRAVEAVSATGNDRVSDAAARAYLAAINQKKFAAIDQIVICLLYTSDAADE